jgi:protein SCO1/2
VPSPPPAASRPTPATLVGLAAAALAALAIAIVAARHRGAAAPPPVYAKIAGFSLVNQASEPVSLGAFGGKVWVADFIFTTCQSACPALTQRMKDLADWLARREAEGGGRDLGVRLVSFTVDPDNDDPAVLAAYASKWGADPRRWSFLTGSLAEMNRAVVEGMKIPFEKRATATAFDILHGERFVLVDRHGRIRGYHETTPEGLSALEAAIDAVLREPGP